ncbi:MAG: hypothetical protein RIQ93_1747 [Verrucomicrobiota bacterium]|jgi:membrane protein DedA with SNARE-associated domain
MESLFQLFHGSPFALWVLFALLILCGVGLPMPEDIILIGAGLIAEESGHSWIAISFLMYLGVLAGDSLIFAVGRRFGCRILTLMRNRNWVSRTKQEKIEALFRRHGATAFFVARFMPGLRAPFFCTAGAMKARYAQFVLFDSLAALISVPAFVWLGRFLWSRFSDDFVQLSGVISRTHTYTLIASAAVLAAILSAVWWNWDKLNGR